MNKIIALFTLLCYALTLAPAEAAFLHGGTTPFSINLALPGTPAAVYSTLKYTGWA